MENPVLTPNSVNVLQPTILYNQLTNNSDVFALSTSVSAANSPGVRTDGSGNAWLQGSLNVTTASPTANLLLGTLPARLTPQNNYVFPVAVLRSGAYVPNAINIASNGSGISAITVDTAGSYATLPTVSTTGPGTGATLALNMEAVSVTPAAAGSGYVPADTITATGGTGTAFVATVATTKLISAVVNAAGTGYKPADTITTAGGTASIPAVLTVSTTKVVSATVAAAGTGGTDGTQTVTGTTGTGTHFQASVTVATGSISAVLSISVAGSYTVNPTVIADEPVTGASLTGAALNVVMGASTVTVSNAGVYTVNATTFTQASTSGSGTGATFNTLSFGVNTASVSTPGSYTVLPASPVAQGSTSGAGTGVTLTTLWGLLSVTVSAAGVGYTSASSFQLNGGGGTGGGTGSIVLGASSVGQITLITDPQQNDVVILDSPAFLVLAPNE